MKALVLIDVQNDFIDGSLGSEWAQRTVPKIAEFVKAHPEFEVFATRDTHFDKDNNLGEIPYEETLEGKRLPVRHCINGTHGWQLSDQVKHLITSEDNIVDKFTFMSLQNVDVDQLNLYEVIDDKTGGFDPKEIVICGFVTSICVIANALMLRGNYPNTKITLLEDLCADVTKENHEAALKVMQAQQIDIKTVQDYEKD